MIISFNDKSNPFVLCFDCFINFQKAFVFINRYALVRSIKFYDKFLKILILPLDEISDYLEVISDDFGDYYKFISYYHFSFLINLFEDLKRGISSIIYQQIISFEDRVWLKDIFDLRFILSSKSFFYLLQKSYNYNEILQDTNSIFLHDFKLKLDNKNNYFDLNMIRLRKLLKLIT